MQRQLEGFKKKDRGPKKKKKKGQNKGSEKEYGKDESEERPRSPHKTMTKSLKPDRRKCKGPLETDPEDCLETEKYGHMAASAAGALAIEWLSEIEDVRYKSSSMQGRLSGILKRNVIKLKEIVRSREQSRSGRRSLLPQNKELRTFPADRRV